MHSQDKRLFLKKRPRYGEIAIEWSIRIVSSASILIIALIFLFVFREAAGIFHSETDNMPTQQTIETESAEQSDIYNPDSGTADMQTILADDDLKPEIYNPDSGEEVAAVPSTDSPPTLQSAGPGEQSEIYNPDSGVSADLPPAISDGDLKPEIYNPDSGEETGAASPAEVPAMPQQHQPQSIWQNLAGENWQPISEEPKFGVIPLIIGTIKTTFIAIAIAAPLGILAAIYVALFAHRRVREIIKPFIEILAGFPSVVIGFFCLMTVASILQDSFGFDYRLNSIVGGVGLAITVVPIIFTITEDALSAVPKTYREASLALGATEWETAFRLMLPAALPGVIAAVLLGIGRAFGETMIALMATGNAPLAEWNLAAPARTLAATIGAEMGEVIWGSTHYSILFFLGALLFLVSFAINLLTEVFVRRHLAKKFQGS